MEKTHKQNKRGLVSIILPVYNTREYLPRAVGSVREQTWDGWELLMMDDGSTDGSGELCDRLAGEDERIRVFHQPNGGVSRARNKLLDEARGEFICFLDSDDAYDPSFLEILLEMHEKSGGLPVCCGFLEQRGEESFSRQKPMEDLLVSRDEFLFEALRGTLELPLCCVTWLLPRDKVRDLRFDEDLGYGEDTLFILKALSRFEQLYYDPRPLYLYQTDRQGNTNTERSLKKNESRLRSAGRAWELFRSSGSKTEQALLKYMVECAAECARAAGREKKKEKVHFYIRQACRYQRLLGDCRDIGTRDRIRLWGYAHFPRLSEKIMRGLYGRV